jgi:hypothetical protein
VNVWWVACLQRSPDFECCGDHVGDQWAEIRSDAFAIWPAQAWALSDVCLCVARGMLAVWLTSGLCVCECVWMDSRAGWLVWMVAKRARVPFGL